jgi:hypothetical protein
MSEMREALAAMAQHRAASVHVNRTGWTREQWIEDAQRLMDDIDGSVMSLVNGHVLALLDEVYERRAGETARHAIPQPHVRSTTDQGSDYCLPCSEATQQWVKWPCAHYTCPSTCVELNHPGREHADWLAD